MYTLLYFYPLPLVRLICSCYLPYRIPYQLVGYVPVFLCFYFFFRFAFCIFLTYYFVLPVLRFFPFPFSLPFPSFLFPLFLSFPPFLLFLFPFPSFLFRFPSFLVSFLLLYNLCPLSFLSLKFHFLPYSSLIKYLPLFTK